MSFKGVIKPGQLPILKSEDGNVMLVGSKPEWIKLPKTLGGTKVNITESFIAKACKCGGNHSAKVMLLDCEYMVVECPTKGYTWMAKPKDIEAFKMIMM